MKPQEAFEREPQELWEGRITALLRKKASCGEREVAKLMRSMGLQGRCKGYRVTTKSSHSHRKFPNLTQNFQCEREMHLLLLITSIPQRGGGYLATTAR